MQKKKIVFAYILQRRYGIYYSIEIFTLILKITYFTYIYICITSYNYN